MPRWFTEIETRAEFVQRARDCPELLVVRGMLGRRYGPQSLRTVLDEQPQLYVENPVADWSALMLRRGRHSFEVLPAAGRTRNANRRAASNARRF